MKSWLALLVLLLIAVAAVQAQSAPETKALTLVLGKGDLLRFDSDVQRVAVAEPRVADAIVVSPREVMINAKGVGNTTIMVWEVDKVPQRYDINVVGDNSDIEVFRSELRIAFPD